MRPRPVTPSEMRRLEENAQELGVSAAGLMQKAASALADAVAKSVRRHRASGAWFLCGHGNNGGDGLLAARIVAKRGIAVRVTMARPLRKSSPLARAQAASLPAGIIDVWQPSTRVRENPVIVDCLLGSGLVGPPRAPYDAIVRFLNRQRRPVVACDVPSGTGTPLSVRAGETVTFHAPKPGLESGAGRVIVAPIGIPRRAHEIGLGDLDAGYPRPRWDSHKGDNGRVLVVAGSIPYTGAPAYVGIGAYRSGADLVEVVTPSRVAATLRSQPGLIVHDAGPGERLKSEGVAVARRLLERAGALVIGPGLGRHPETAQAIQLILEAAAKAALPTVVDADALDALTPDLMARHPRLLLTPHHREFLELAGFAATRAGVTSFARRHGVTVVAKAAVTVVSNGHETRLCRRGHPTLTVGGTGDVLAGVAGELLAKGTQPFPAGCAATYLVKCAGEVAADLRSYGAMASDVAEAIPAILLRLP
ncbi:MAG: NAD(P)H-hydrate dehydratase [Thermoplasmatota archaeon]